MISLHLKKKWQLKADSFVTAEALPAVKELRLSPLIAAILAQRGLVDPQLINEFLFPTLNNLPSPYTLTGMDKAVVTILAAMEEKRTFLLYGDYDVDGVTALTVLALFFRQVGLNIFCLQPDRLRDGYGFHYRVVANFLQKKGMTTAAPPLVITVDCGISDNETVALLKQDGCIVIITDHHTPPSILPPADAILNPKLCPNETLVLGLAGVGVAFYLVMALRSRLQERGFWDKAAIPNLKAYLDLVAIGTICDVAPMQGANRILVRAGLDVLSQSYKRPGIQSLLRKSNLTGSAYITEDDIGFRLGPRINAPSRIDGDPTLSLRLFLSDDPREAEVLAQRLEEFNQERRKHSDQVFFEANVLAGELLEAGKQAIVLANKSWHPGVLGIAAAKIMDIYGRPVILLYCKDKIAKGSGRSLRGLNLHELLSATTESLIDFGGHSAAAGLRLEVEAIADFSEQFDKAVARAMAGQKWGDGEIAIDAVLTGDELRDPKFLQQYIRLHPFGIGNEEPVFTMNRKKFGNVRVVGKNHLRFQLHEDGVSMAGIGFGFSQMLEPMRQGETDIAFVLKQQYYNGTTSWEFRMIDVRNSTAGSQESEFKSQK